MGQSNKILIIDDKNHLYKTLPHLLNYEIDYTSDFNSILNNSFNLTYDLYLVDYQLSDNLVGSDICAAILRTDPRASILGISFHNEPNVLFDFIRAGANGFILKNSNFEVYETAIRQILKKKVYFEIFEGMDISELSNAEAKTYALYLHQVDVKRISEIMNCKPRTIYNRISRSKTLSFPKGHF
jgi:DNA-binding NarL/FixJ family response regulator